MRLKFHQPSEKTTTTTKTVPTHNLSYSSLSEMHTMQEKFRFADLTQNQRQFITKQLQIKVLDPRACL